MCGVLSGMYVLFWVLGSRVVIRTLSERDGLLPSKWVCREGKIASEIGKVVDACDEHM